jgi:hypothetical protein
VTALNAQRAAQAIGITRKPSEGGGAVAAVQKANEERRRARREAALRVVAELGSEETQGPARLESALVTAADKGSRRRRPSQPPPLPKEGAAIEAVAAMPSPFASQVAAVESVSLAAVLATPIGSGPARDVAILTSATQEMPAAPPVATKLGPPPPPRPPLGGGMLARYGQGSGQDLEAKTEGPRKSLRVVAAVAVAIAVAFAIIRML